MVDIISKEDLWYLACTICFTENSPIALLIYDWPVMLYRTAESASFKGTFHRGWFYLALELLSSVLLSTSSLPYIFGHMPEIALCTGYVSQDME